MRGAETRLKTSRVNRSSQDFDNAVTTTLTDLGTDRPRFPALGRRRFTFDAFVRAHYGSRLSSFHRRVASARYARLRPRQTTRFRLQTLKNQSKRSFRALRTLSKSFAVSTYLPPRDRELLQRAVGFPARLEAVGFKNSKRLLAALPLAQYLRVNKTRRLKLIGHSGNNESLLQLALRKRFFSRRIRHLRKAGRRRKLRSIAKPPF